MNPDAINGTYEGLGAVFVLATCLNLWKSKQAWGVSIIGIIFFTSWGVWNLYYYPHLHQWWSFSGGVCIVLSNMLYVGLLVWIRKHYPKSINKESSTCMQSSLCDELVCNCAIPGPDCDPDHCMRKT